MDLTWISDHLSSLDGVREEVSGSRTTWRVKGRLVARLEDEHTLLVHAQPADRERLAARLPDAFYVTQAIEDHYEVLVHLPLADPDDVRPVLTAAWELQR